MFLQGPRDEFRRVADSWPARVVLILKAPARIRKIPQQFFHKDALRLRRIMARDGISEEYAQKRIDAQQGNDFYWENCDAVLENVYEDPQTFERAVQRFFEELIRIYGKENQLS